jgi:hypothetical protein
MALANVAVLVMVGCSPGGPGATTAPTQAPTTTGPTVPASAAATTTAPVGDAKLVLWQQHLFAWDDPAGGPTQVQVIGVVRNDGSAWAELTPGSSYGSTIRNAAGVEVLELGLTFALPKYVEPGALAFIFTGGAAPGLSATDLAAVEIARLDAANYSAAAGPALTSEFGDITWQSAGAGKGLVASGTVTVSGADIPELGLIGVFCSSAEQKILGVAFEAFVSGLTADVPLSFETSAPAPPMDASACATTFGLVGEVVYENDPYD